MGKKNNFNITLAGKSYILCGEESSEYLKKIGTYIEQKYNSYYGNLSFRSQPIDMQHILMQLNIADDYFKQKEENELVASKLKEYTKRCEKHEKETKDLQDKIDEQANEIQKLKIEIAKLEMRK